MRFINNMMIIMLTLSVVACGSSKRAGSVYNQPYQSDIIEQTTPNSQEAGFSEAEIKSFFSVANGETVNLRHEMVVALDKYYAASTDLCRRFEIETTKEKKILCMPAGENQFKNAFIKRALR